MNAKEKPAAPKAGKRVLIIVVAIITTILICFGAVYIYYSTGHGAAVPTGFESIRGLNNAEDMV